jgi:hypothetical protein
MYISEVFVLNIYIKKLLTGKNVETTMGSSVSCNKTIDV